jgi:hypothetical protein
MNDLAQAAVGAADSCEGLDAQFLAKLKDPGYLDTLRADAARRHEDVGRSQRRVQAAIEKLPKPRRAPLDELSRAIEDRALVHLAKLLEEGHALEGIAAEAVGLAWDESFAQFEAGISGQYIGIRSGIVESVEERVRLLRGHRERLAFSDPQRTWSVELWNNIVSEPAAPGPTTADLAQSPRAVWVRAELAQRGWRYNGPNKFGSGPNEKTVKRMTLGLSTNEGSWESLVASFTHVGPPVSMNDIPRE